MKYKINDKEIIIAIPANMKGKFRFKQRDNNLKFGESFATRSKIFDDKVYLEWQIGYDATKSDIKKGKKKTKLTQMTFIGDNKKEKYPHELSELVYAAIKLRLIPIEKIRALLKEIERYHDDYISENNSIRIGHKNNLIINDLPFKETTTILPTFFMVKTPDSTQIETSIQKQQYATGVQPMVYFCIPLKAFRNYKEFIGRSSKPGDELIYAFNKNNASILLDMIKIFAMCSGRHNHDIREILKVLIKLSGK